MNVFQQEQLLVVLNLRAFPVVSLQMQIGYLFFSSCIQCISWSILRVHTVHVSSLTTPTNASDIMNQRLPNLVYQCDPCEYVLVGADRWKLAPILVPRTCILLPIRLFQNSNICKHSNLVTVFLIAFSLESLYSITTLYPTLEFIPFLSTRINLYEYQIP